MQAIMRLYNVVKEWYSKIYDRIYKHRIEQRGQCIAFIEQINRIIQYKGDADWTYYQHYNYWNYMAEYIENLAKYKRAVLKSKERSRDIDYISAFVLFFSLIGLEDSSGEKFVGTIIFIIIALLTYSFANNSNELDIVFKHTRFFDLDVAYYETRKCDNIDIKTQMSKIRNGIYGYSGIDSGDICRYCVLRLESMPNVSLYPYTLCGYERKPQKDEIVHWYHDSSVGRVLVYHKDLAKNLNYILGDIDFT